MTAITNFVRPRYFLLLAGAVLVLMGLSGVVGLLALISRASVFNPPYWINWVHLTFGIVVVTIALAGGRVLQNVMTLAAAFIGITLGLSGLLFGPYAANVYSIPELADPSDHLAHLAVGLLALWAWWNRKVAH